jgi:O-antigen/teichoic acid export membrane protein
VRGRVSSGIRSTLADGQLRAGIDLVSSSALNALAGIAFWVVAARGFDEVVVGVNATLITTMGLVQNLASLGMKNGLIRFIPSYRPFVGRLVWRTYALTTATAAVVAPLVAIVLANRIETLSALSSWQGVLGFTFACVAWMVFVLQDSVLVALNRTPLIPLTNLIYAISKLVLLFLLALGAWRWSIFVAWVAPVVLVLVWVNVIIRKMLHSQKQVSCTFNPEPGLTRFAAGEHVTTMLSAALFGLLPVYVLSEFGERASAFYALAWTIAYNLILVNSNIGTALLATSARDPERIALHARKAALQMASLVVPAAIGLAVVAPVALRVFGASYAAESSDLLRIFAAAAVVNIPVAIAIAVLRAHRQMSRLIGLFVLRTCVIGGFCVGLSGIYGLVGIGWGWLIGETLIAVVALSTVWHPSRPVRS